MASLQFTGRTQLLQNTASIHGTKASVEIPDFFWCPSEINTPSGRYENSLPEVDIPYNFSNAGGLRYEADSVRACLQKGMVENPIMTLRDSEILMTINDEIRRQLGVVYDVD